MLKQLLEEGRNLLATRDPILHMVAPPVSTYWKALDAEISDMELDEVKVFVSTEIAKALAGFGPEHPIKQELQAGYRKEIPSIIDRTVQRLDQSFEDLLDYLAQERHRLALQYCHHPVDRFGAPRTDETRLFRTAFTRIGRYRKYYERVMAMVPNSSKDFRPPATFDINIGLEWIPKLDGVTIWKEIKGQRIPLTTILVCAEFQSDEMLQWMFGDRDTPYPSAAMIHTDVQYIPLLKDVCRELFEKARENPTEIETIAALQWYLAHAMLQHRGSASIAEWLVEALFASGGLKATYTSQPDLEALLTHTPAEFASNYRNIYQIEKHPGPH